jgi:signal transduction histidine kinase
VGDRLGFHNSEASSGPRREFGTSLDGGEARPSRRSDADRASRDEQLDMGLALTAHEIRGPLLGVRAGLEVLLRRAATDAVEVSILQRSLEELEQLAGTTEDLLTWAAGTRELQRRAEDVVELVDDAVESCRRETGMDRVVVCAPPALVAQVDASQLRSAVTNLVRNALTYADPGTKVEVTVTADANSLMLEVRDEGPVIPEADQARIFDPFVRGRANGGAGSGSGLGLTFCMRLPRKGGGQRFVS